MRYAVQTSLVLSALAAFLLCSGDVWAKGGRGGGKGGGGGHVSKGNFSAHGSSRGGNRFTDPATAGRQQLSNHKQQLSNKSFSQPKHPRDFASTGSQPWDKHQWREQRKLDHSRQVADHLRRVSDQNGNEHLKQVADDMDQRSQAHYDQQMDRIRQKYGLDDSFGSPTEAPANPLHDSLGDAGRAFDGGDNALGKPAPRLTGRENALSRQLQNAQRQLDKRLQKVDQMRATANANGDQAMLDNADRLEEWANGHFDQRMEQITDFQDRHGLPAINGPLAP